MTEEIGAGTLPGPLLCGDACGREAALVVVTLADREAEYVCWPCLIGRCVQVAMEFGDQSQPNG